MIAKTGRTSLLYQIFCIRRLLYGDSLKCRADNIKRLNVRSPVEKAFENLQYFGITACAVSLCISFVFPETDGRDFSATRDG